MGGTKQRTTEVLLFLLPAITLIAALWIYPILQTFWYSFHRAHLIRGVVRYEGLVNYVNLLASARFQRVLWRTLIWVTLSVPMSLLWGTVGALILHNEMPARNLFRALCFIPWVLPQSLVGVIWKWLVNSSYGLVNNILVALSITTDGVSFVTPELALITSVFMRVWRGSPFVLISVLSGLQSIPTNLFEAGRIDGATYWQQLRYIVIPFLRPVFVMAITLVTLWSFIVFDMIYVFTGGGPASATEILPLAVYRRAFHDLNIGVASAMAIIGLILISVLTVFYFRLQRKEDT